jgi:hypothetical protein
MLRKISYPVLILVGALIALLTIHPATPVHTAVSLPTASTSATPAATPTLPACESEDGSGQALCMWDASESGNGEGTDAVGGECAMGSVGITTKALSALCVRVWSIPAYTRGNDSWNGKGMVSECTDIEWERQSDKESASILKEDGWTLEECLKGMLSENS